MIDFNLAPSQHQTADIDPVGLFTEDMRNAGLDPADLPTADGIFHGHVQDRQDRPGKKNLWYILHGDGVPAGMFGHYVLLPDGQRWQGKPDNTLTPRERNQIKERIEQSRAARDKERDEIRAACRAKAETMLAAGRDVAADHPYVTGHGIIPYGARQLKEMLLIPLYKNQVLTGLQVITPEGKRFLTGTEKSGACLTINGSAQTIYLLEGWADACKVHELTGATCVVCFDCGNLEAVAREIRTAWPDHDMVVIADNDRLTAGNPGVTHGRAAALATGARLAIPTFPGDEGKDICDLAAISGNAAVISCLEAAAKQTEATPDAGTVTPDAVTSAAPQVEPKSAPFSMADLVEKKFKPIQWVIPGLLAEGLAILSGPPKIGKSWMVMDFCIAVVSGGFALGHFQAIQGGALLGSLEDNERRLQSRLKKRLKHSGGANLDQFHAITTWKRLDQGGLNDLDEWLKDHPACRLVVIDTIQKIKAKPSSKNGNAYENDYESYGALQRLALQRQCSILLIHHNRKSDSKNDGDPLEAISGSTGITGTMDTILMLRRPRGTAGAVLTVTGRDIQDAEYGLSFDQALCGWTVTGKAAEVGLQDGSNASLIVEILKEQSGKMLTAQEIFDALDGSIKLTILKTELYRLSKKGLIRNMHGKFAYMLPGANVLPVLPVLPPISTINTINIGEGVARNLYDGESSTGNTINTINTSNTVSTDNTINTSNTETIPVFTEEDFEGVML